MSTTDGRHTPGQGAAPDPWASPPPPPPRPAPAPAAAPEGAAQVPPPPQPYPYAPPGAAAQPYGAPAYGAPPFGAAPYPQQPYAQHPFAQQPYAQQPYAQQPYAPQPYAPQGYGPVGYPVVRRYPAVLPLEGRRPPLWVFLVVLVLFLAPSVWYWWRYGPVGDVPFLPIHRLGRIETGFALGVVLITVVFRWSRSVGWVRRPRTALAVPLIAVALIVTSALLIASAGSALAWGATAYVLLLLNFLAVGVFEETLFRGWLWAALPERWSASRVLLVTSVCFGAVHVTNGFTTGRWGIAAVQACVVSVSGLGLGALRLRTGWLALGVVTHAFIDAGLSAGSALAPLLKDVDTKGPIAPSLAFGTLLMLALLALYATLAIAGIVVLVRTFRSERQLRRLAAWFPAGAGPSAGGPAAPPTLVA